MPKTFMVQRQPIGLTTICLALLSSMGGFLFGYDTGQISDMLLMSDFQDRFSDTMEQNAQGEWEPAYTKVREGLIVALLSIGTLVGAVLGSWFADKLGRRFAMTIECGVFSVGVLIQITTNRAWQQLAVGRLVSGLGVGALSAAVPVYMSECVAPNFRGTAVACYQLMITFGILMAYCWCIGTRTLESDASWRIIVGLGFVFAFILGAGVWLLPESPRWLVKHGHHDKGKESLSRIRGVNNDYDRAVVEHDFLEIIKHVKLEEHAGTASWVECFIGTKGVSKLAYRTFLGMFIQSFQQLTGANYFFYYGATIFNSVGIEDSFVTQIILGAVNFVCTFGGLYVMENFGRRKPLVISGIWQFIWLVIFASAGTARDPRQEGNEAFGKLMIVSACLFIAGYASTWGPAAWIITGETFPLRTRSKQAALATAANWAWNFLISFFSPFIDEDINFAYGYVFAGCNLAAALFAFFFLYESADLTLEQVDEMYSTKGLKPWKSGKWTPEGYKKRGDAMEQGKEEGVGGAKHIEHVPAASESSLTASADGHFGNGAKADMKETV